MEIMKDFRHLISFENTWTLGLQKVFCRFYIKLIKEKISKKLLPNCQRKPCITYKDLNLLLASGIIFSQLESYRKSSL